MPYQPSAEKIIVHGYFPVIRSGMDLSDVGGLTAKIQDSFVNYAPKLYNPTGDDGGPATWEERMGIFYIDIFAHDPSRDGEVVRHKLREQYPTFDYFRDVVNGMTQKTPGTVVANNVMIRIYSVVDSNIPSIDTISGVNSAYNALLGMPRKSRCASIWRAVENGRTWTPGSGYRKRELMELVMRGVWIHSWGVDPASEQGSYDIQNLARSFWLPHKIRKSKLRTPWPLETSIPMGSTSGRAFWSYTTDWNNTNFTDAGIDSEANDEYHFHSPDLVAGFGKEIFVCFRDGWWNYTGVTFATDIHDGRPIIRDTANPDPNHFLVKFYDEFKPLQNQNTADFGNSWNSWVIFYPIEAYDPTHPVHPITDHRRAFYVKPVGSTSFWTNMYDEKYFELEAMHISPVQRDYLAPIPVGSMDHNQSYRSSRRFRLQNLFGGWYQKKRPDLPEIRFVLRRKGTPFISELSLKKIKPRTWKNCRLLTAAVE